MRGEDQQVGRRRGSGRSELEKIPHAAASAIDDGRRRRRVRLPNPASGSSVLLSLGLPLRLRLRGLERVVQRRHLEQGRRMVAWRVAEGGRERVEKKEN